MDKSQEIGITENTDVAFHLEAFDNLRKANIIITKRLTDPLIEKLVEHKEQIILHLTCTGMGGSKLEPFVPVPSVLREKFDDLVLSGFPVSHVVLRIDPIITTPKGVQTALKVLKLFSDSGITRIRWSSIDMYEHVRERFEENKIPIPQDKFHASKPRINGLYSILQGICYINDWELSACGEPGFEPTPCISKRDLEILGLENEIELVGKKEQRSSCSCPSNKVQLIQCKPERCEHKCLYCYWKD